MNSSQPLYLSEQWTTAADPDLAVTTRGVVPPPMSRERCAPSAAYCAVITSTYQPGCE